MSMELKLAQGKIRLGSSVVPRPMGDPGLFGFIGDAFKTATQFVRDPVGTVAGVIGGLFDPDEEPLSVPVSIASNQSRPINVAQNLFQQQQQQNGINFPFGGERGAGVDTPFGRLSFLENGGGNGQARPPVIEGKCIPGWHANKSSYFLRNGTFIRKGSMCVKNRRRNDMNNHAISNSIKRLTGAKKASKAIGRVTIRCARCPGKCTCR